MDLNSTGHILWHLKSLTKQAGSVENSSLRETQFELIEHLLLTILRCKRYDSAVQHGYQIVENFGYRPNVCKCIVLGLCHMAKYQECCQFLERWRQVNPKDSTMLTCKQKVEEFILAVGCSAVKPVSSLTDLEGALSLLPLSLLDDPLKKTTSPSPLSALVTEASALLGSESLMPSYRMVVSPSQPSTQLLKSTSPLPLSQCHVHPPYLSKLIKQIRSSTNVSTLLVDKLDGVKIKCFTDVDAVVRGTDHRWAFAINSKEAMRTVSLLGDASRDNFSITGAYFYHAENKTINLLDIHPTNKLPQLQVLNTFVPADLLRGLGGWPSCFTYKIEIRFKGTLPGKYKQTIVFDFKKDPKIIRHISAEFENVPTSALNSGRSTPAVGPGAVGSTIVPVKNQEPAHLLAVQRTEWHKNTGPTLLHKTNYVSAQDRIINCEMQFLQTHLRQNGIVQNMKLTKSYILEKKFGNEMKMAEEGEIFLVLEVGSSSFKDTVFGKLVDQHCNCVLISHTAYPTHSYTCKIKEKMQDKWIIALDFNQVLELGLRLDQSCQFKIEFILDISHFAEITRLLGLVGDIELRILFPDITSKLNIAIDTFDGTLQEGLFSLNPRQVDAFNVITKFPLTLAYVPPILLIGPPGSGKTYTLTESIKKVLMMHPTTRILVCTQSNAAADKFVETFDEWIKSGLKVKMIRVYDCDHASLEDIPMVVKRYCTLGPDFNVRTPLKEEIQQVNIVVTTINTTSILSKTDVVDLGKYYFSHIIIDEAGNQLEVDLIAPIVLANPNTRIVFAGDQNSYNQLSSVSSNILERLNLHYPDGHVCKIILNETYRTHPDILKFLSDYFSPVKLRCSSIQSAHPKYHPLTYCAVKGGEAKSRNSYYNISEVIEISNFTQSLVATWPAQWGKYQEQNSIAVFTNYEDQIVHLRNHLRSVGLGFVAVEGIWNLKANWYRVVMLSTVRSYDSTSPVVDDSGFFNNYRLIYNALTRTQNLFVVFGDPSLCAFGLSCDIWKAFINAATLNEITVAERVASSAVVDEDFSTFQLWGKALAPPITPDQSTSRPTSLSRPLTFNNTTASEEYAMAKFMESNRITNSLDDLSALGESILAQLNGHSNLKDPFGNVEMMNFDLGKNASSSTNSSKTNSLPPRLTKDKNNRSKKKSGNEGGKKMNGSTTNGSGGGKRPESASSKKATGGANLNDMIINSVINKLDNMGVSSQQDGSTQDKERTKSNNDWVEVKKTKKSKRSKNKNPANTSNTTNTDTTDVTSTDEKVKYLLDMGYEKRRAMKALQRADKDLSKAIEYLVTGTIPGTPEKH